MNMSYINEIIFQIQHSWSHMVVNDNEDPSFTCFKVCHSIDEVMEEAQNSELELQMDEVKQILHELCKDPETNSYTMKSKACELLYSIA